MSSWGKGAIKGVRSFVAFYSEQLNFSKLPRLEKAKASLDVPVNSWQFPYVQAEYEKASLAFLEIFLLAAEKK